MIDLDIANAKRLAIALPLPTSTEQTLLSKWLGGGTKWHRFAEAAWAKVTDTADFTPAEPNTPAAASLALLDSGVLDAHMPRVRLKPLRLVLHAIVNEKVMDAPIVDRHSSGVYVACPYCWPDHDGSARRHSHRLQSDALLPLLRPPACPPGPIPHAYRIVAPGAQQ